VAAVPGDSLSGEVELEPFGPLAESGLVAVERDAREVRRYLLGS
jgi:hypothetical protein